MEEKSSTSSKKEVVCRVSQASILGPLLFLIYMNGLPSVCKFLEIFHFAGDTILTVIDNQQQEFEIDINYFEYWLKTNHLVLFFRKIMQVNLISTTGLTFEIDETQIESKPVCKYLGAFVDFKLCFNTHLNVLEKIGKRSGIVSKLQHCAPRNHLILVYKTNILPTIQYDVLIHGCCSYTSLLTIVKLKRKIVRLITFKKGFLVQKMSY